MKLIKRSNSAPENGRFEAQNGRFDKNIYRVGRLGGGRSAMSPTRALGPRCPTCPNLSHFAYLAHLPAKIVQARGQAGKRGERVKWVKWGKDKRSHSTAEYCRVREVSCEGCGCGWLFGRLPCGGLRLMWSAVWRVCVCGGPRAACVEGGLSGGGAVEGCPCRWMSEGGAVQGCGGVYAWFCRGSCV